MAPSTEVPERLLLACSSIEPGLTAGQVAKALTAGLAAAGASEPDILELPDTEAQTRGAAGSALLEQEHFDDRMRAARAVVLVVPRLRESDLAGSLTFEIATRARQAGVPCYAISPENDLNLFDTRVLDLQTVIRAADARSLRLAARQLAGLV